MIFLWVIVGTTLTFNGLTLLWLCSLVVLVDGEHSTPEGYEVELPDAAAEFFWKVLFCVLDSNALGESLQEALTHSKLESFISSIISALETREMGWTTLTRLTPQAASLGPECGSMWGQTTFSLRAFANLRKFSSFWAMLFDFSSSKGARASSWHHHQWRLPVLEFR